MTPDPELREHIARLEPWLDDPENGTYPTYSVPLFAAGEGEHGASGSSPDAGATPSPAAPPVERCPTCNSDARWFCNVDGEFHRLDDDPSGQCCTDPWHSDLGADPTTNPEGD